MTRAIAVLIGALVVPALVAPAHGQPWLAAEVPAAWPVSSPQRTAFRPGALPALGLYQPVARGAAIGVRARAGVLGDGAAPGAGLRDPGLAGLGTVSVATRIAAGGWWLELAGGAAITGADLVPALELGAGVTRPVGGLELGPVVRLLHVDAPDMAVGFGAADVALLGLEVRRRARPPAARRPAVAARTPVAIATRPAPRPVEAVPAPRDLDPLRDRLTSCRELAAVLAGGTPGDGCAVEGDVVVHHDRIVLSEQVLFELNRARVRRRARPVIAAIARMWTDRSPDARLVVEGHADVRGPDDFNVWLSQERAVRARAALIAAGVAAARIDAVGRGTAQPRDPGRDEAAHARNRRVEFVIVHAGAAP
ncbi:MAG TPA: OmpA family protein [Kofleriaceae bacterium]|nr:OmpA family protein [Kofleriaceae bacterium]